MTNPNLSNSPDEEPAASPEKEPATGEQAAEMAAGNADRAATATAPKQPEPEPRPSLGRLFLDNLWAANTVTVTVLAVLLAMLVGAVLIIVSDPEVLATYGYITARPSDAINSSWTVVSEAYANLFKGAIFDPDASEI